MNFSGKTSTLRLPPFADLYLGIGGVITHTFLAKHTEQN